MTLQVPVGTIEGVRFRTVASKRCKCQHFDTNILMEEKDGKATAHRLRCIPRMGKVCTRAIVGLASLLAYCACAFALDPSLDVSQYAHTSWNIRDGFFKGVISSIGQTPDGYLWLGTELGLLRFDGVRAIPWQPPAGEKLPSDYIRSLLVARDGTLWIGTRNGLASWRNGKLAQYPELAGQFVVTLL